MSFQIPYTTVLVVDLIAVYDRYLYI